VEFLQAVQSHQIDYAFLVPTMIQMVVDHPALKEFDTRSLKTLSYGGSPISESLLRRTREAFPNAGLRQNYGMTEFAGSITVLGPQFHTEHGESLGKLKSTGRPSLMSRIEIVDAHGEEVPTGTVGEIRVRSPGVMAGYWNKPELTAGALRDGWLYTGDAGRMDEDGFLFIVDRLKDMIVTGGENVYSAEVEHALAQHPSVAMSAVIGIPDEKWGEAVHAIVQLKSGHSVSSEALIEHVRERIANYKAPRSLEFRDALPISGAGKIQKGELRKPFWSTHERQVS
jgi:acyl-CoA synthetase (AMP-forming)/AMP-acid ligase II